MRKTLFVIVAIAGCICLGIACKQDNPTPVPPAKSSPPTVQNDAEDMKAVSEFMNKDKPAGTGQGALPSGHPPISGGTAPVEPPLPSGHPPIGQGGGAMGAPAAGGPDAISYTAPAAWKTQPVTSQMRKAQFLIPRAESDTEDGQMVVFYFGQGQGGGVESNITRWKGMFSDADGKPIEDLAIKREAKEINGLKVTTVDITGRYTDAMAGRTSVSPQEWRMLSAIVETPQGLWFFKGVGPVATMKAQEQSFQSLIGSMKVK